MTKGWINGGRCRLLAMADGPGRRLEEAIFVTETEIIVWGGLALREDFPHAHRAPWFYHYTGGPHGPGGRDNPDYAPTSSGAILSLSDYRWRPMSEEGAPPAAKRPWVAHENGVLWVHSDAGGAFRYDVESDRWTKVDAPPHGLSPFSYTDGYVGLGVEPPTVIQAPPEMQNSGFPVPLWRSLPVVGRVGEYTVATLGGSLQILFGITPGGKWARLEGLDQDAQEVNIETRERRPARRFRMVWAGDRLVAWGGFRVEEWTYRPQSYCPPGAPCAAPRPVQQGWIYMPYDDGLVYTPSPEKWKCVFRYVPTASGSKTIPGGRCIEDGVP